MATPRQESQTRLTTTPIRVTLEREGKDSHEIRVDQVTTESLR